MSKYFSPNRLTTIENSTENPLIPVDDLPDHLGMGETEAMTELHAQYVSAYQGGDTEKATEVFTSYYNEGVRLVFSKENEEYPRAQIGLWVQSALLRRDVGRLPDYLKDLDAAADAASMSEFDDILNSIFAAKSEALSDVLKTFGDDYGFDEETCEKVAAMAYPQALEVAEGLLAHANLNPDELLAPFYTH